MIESQPGRFGTVVVVFRLPGAAAAEIAVVGEFNGWSNVATPMTREADGFVARVTVPIGRSYRFRYLLDGHRWQNDWAADDYVANEFGGDDSVIDVGPASLRAGLARARWIAEPPTFASRSAS